MRKFETLAADLLQQAQELLPRWLPGGQFAGGEFRCGSLQGEKGKSLSINLATGRWSDFATDDRGGDLISLYAKIHGLTNAQAYDELSSDIKTPVPGAPAPDESKPKPRAAIPQAFAPENAPPPPEKFHFRSADNKSFVPRPVGLRWTYLDKHGRLVGHVCRFDYFDEEGKAVKDVIPQTWVKKGTKEQWGWKAFAEPRPLYNLPMIVNYEDKPVMVVEGEKCAEAAQAMVGDRYVVTTWPGGSKALHKADWSALSGRKVLLWPDADEAGRECMFDLAEKIGKTNSVKLVDDAAMPAGWDAADAQAEGWDWERLREWAKKNVSVMTEVKPRKKEPKPPLRTGQKPGIPRELTEMFATTASTRNKLWEQLGLEMGGRSGERPRTNLDNVVRVLELHKPLENVVWYDEMLDRVLTDRDGGLPREWRDDDDVWLQLYMQRMIGLSDIGLAPVVDAISHFVKRPERIRNGFVEAIDAEVWDGVGRIDDFFVRVYGAEENEYTLSVGRGFWLSMVARVMSPGCQADNMVVLEGAQGSRKSTSLRELVGDTYFAENHAPASDKKAFAETLIGKVLVEIAELESFSSKVQVSAIKANITDRSDRFRGAYQRKAADHPRRCIMVGTTNAESYHRDPTGARRFWPIACGATKPAGWKIDIDYIREFRMQMFSEALSRYRAGEQWWDVSEELVKQENDQRMEVDPWHTIISEYVFGRDIITTTMVMNDCLQLPIERQDKMQKNRVSSVLRTLGYRGKSIRRSRFSVQELNDLGFVPHKCADVLKVWAIDPSLPVPTPLPPQPEEQNNEDDINEDPPFDV